MRFHLKSFFCIVFSIIFLSLNILEIVFSHLVGNVFLKKMNLLLKNYLIQTCGEALKCKQKFRNLQISNRYEGNYLQRTVSQTIDEETLAKALNFNKMA